MLFVMIPAVIVLVGLVVLSLVRGIIAFLNSTKQDFEYQGEGASPSQLFRNKMMFNRIKYQALAIVVLMILLATAGGRGGH
jgi:hypothetical protein